MHLVEPASAARELVLEHGFLSFIPEIAIERDLSAGRLIKLQIAALSPCYWDAMMAWRSGKRRDANKQLLLATVRAMAADWGQSG
ncbi:MAG: hypothetical protein HYZ65_02510 [Burkholderiales bacterium]|nr:hypothetical protein [Burkholderiales bacterium]